MVISAADGFAQAGAPAGIPIGGKTGTTNEQVDAWFTGFHPHLATTVWMGYDNNQPLGREETGGGAALPVWMDFMQYALTTLEEVEDKPPTGITTARIDPDTGEAVNSGGVLEYFPTGAAPRAPRATVVVDNGNGELVSQQPLTSEDVEGMF